VIASRPTIGSGNAPLAGIILRCLHPNVSDPIHVERVGNLYATRDSHSMDGTHCQGVQGRIEIATQIRLVKPGGEICDLRGGEGRPDGVSHLIPNRRESLKK
jgi:hypothetical protein